MNNHPLSLNHDYKNENKSRFHGVSYFFVKKRTTLLAFIEARGNCPNALGSTWRVQVAMVIGFSGLTVALKHNANELWGYPVKGNYFVNTVSL